MCLIAMNVNKHENFEFVEEMLIELVAYLKGRTYFRHDRFPNGSIKFSWDDDVSVNHNVLKRFWIVLGKEVFHFNLFQVKPHLLTEELAVFAHRVRSYYGRITCDT